MGTFSKIYNPSTNVLDMITIAFQIRNWMPQSKKLMLNRESGTCSKSSLNLSPTALGEDPSYRFPRRLNGPPKMIEPQYSNCQT